MSVDSFPKIITRCWVAQFFSPSLFLYGQLKSSFFGIRARIDVLPIFYCRGRQIAQTPFRTNSAWPTCVSCLCSRDFPPKNNVPQFFTFYRFHTNIPGCFEDGKRREVKRMKTFTQTTLPLHWYYARSWNSRLFSRSVRKLKVRLPRRERRVSSSRGVK